MKRFMLIFALSLLAASTYADNEEASCGIDIAQNIEIRNPYRFRPIQLPLWVPRYCVVNIGTYHRG